MVKTPGESPRKYFLTGSSGKVLTLTRDPRQASGPDVLETDPRGMAGDYFSVALNDSNCRHRRQWGISNCRHRPQFRRASLRVYRCGTHSPVDSWDFLSRRCLRGVSETFHPSRPDRVPCNHRRIINRIELLGNPGGRIVRLNKYQSLISRLVTHDLTSLLQNDS